MSGFEVLAPLFAGSAVAAGATALSRSKDVKLPKPEPVRRMPDPESPEVAQARRRRRAERQESSGRDSTILASDDYSNELLGQ